MDDNRFDALTRALAEGGTRRGLFRGAAGGAIGWLGLTRLRGHAAAQDSTPLAQDSACINTDSNPLHCGGCHQECESPMEVCVRGRCCTADCPSTMCHPNACPDSACSCPPNTLCNADGSACICAFVTCGAACCQVGEVCRAGKCGTTTATLGTSGTPIGIGTPLTDIVCPDVGNTCEATCDCPRLATCTCACPGPPCAPPRVQNERTCVCECPNACPSPQEQDSATCACTCPPGQNLCDRTGECEACPTGRVFDPATCRCGCRYATCGALCCNEGQVCDASASPPRCCWPHATCPENFCGTVSNSCGGQQACLCGPGRSCCGTACVDQLTDRGNCGGCGQACPPDSDCVDGVCVQDECLLCDGVCVPGAECCRNSDCPDRGPCQSALCGGLFPANTCGYVEADDGLRCPGGVCCGAVCLEGKNCCTDAACPRPETCQNNTCTCRARRTCPRGFCGLDSDGCGRQRLCTCPPGQTCCGDACVDTLTSGAHCGACGRACPDGAGCISGQCVTPGCRLCGGKCISCPAEATLDPESCDCVCETISVPTDGSTVRSLMSLNAGRTYTIRVSGTANVSSKWVDAEYGFSPGGNLETHVCGAYGGDLGLTIDDPGLSGATKTPATWGPYTTSHVYTTTFAGKGAPISLTFNDCPHTDRGYELTVEIFCDCPETAPCEDPRYWDAANCRCVCPGIPSNSSFLHQGVPCDWACNWETCGDRCCQSDQICNAAVDPPQCCTRLAACPPGACGPVADNCGGTFDCGNCSGNACHWGECLSNGSHGQCAYVPSPDSAPGPDCDDVGEFCCGGNCCRAGQVCTNGNCCIPSGICAAGYCGGVANGCGGELLCQCGPGLTCCGELCIDTTASNTNCGACGDTCPTGQFCADGLCTPVEQPVCSPGELACKGRCITCPVGTKLDPQTCACVCDIFCPQERILNPGTCECDCPEATCDAPKVINPDSCRCECPPHDPCPAGAGPGNANYHVDEETCECVCTPPLCPPEGTYNPEFCDCGCETITVPSDGTSVFSTLSTIAGRDYTIRVGGTIYLGATHPLLGDAEYLFDRTDALIGYACGSSQPGPNYGRVIDAGLAIDHPSPYGLAIPPDWGAYRADHVYVTTVKGTGKPFEFTYHHCPTLNNVPRGALVVTILCPPDEVGVTTPGIPVGTLVGEEPLTPETGTPTPGTPTPETLTPETSTPTPTPTPIPPPDCADDDFECGGRCIPAAECPEERCCLDEASCECLCPTCTEFEVFDPSECACECAINGCPPNHAYDEIACTCTCQETACPPNFGFDRTSCACVCVPIACPANLQFDPASCSCICVPPACPPNYQVDPASCSCFCAEVSCADGEVFDPGSCACLPSGGTGGSGNVGTGD